MKALTLCLLSCLSVVAADTNEVRVFTTSATNSEPGYLEAFDVFTRGGQTNLIRQTQTKDGIVLFRTQTFYHHGAELGRYIFNGSETIIGSTPGAPYYLSYRLDSSNRIRSALIGTIRTNDVASGAFTVATLDAFAYSNGVFYPKNGSYFDELNKLAKEHPRR
jgi:hypothetical protein